MAGSAGAHHSGRLAYPHSAGIARYANDSEQSCARVWQRSYLPRGQVDFDMPRFVIGPPGLYPAGTAQARNHARLRGLCGGFGAKCDRPCASSRRERGGFHSPAAHVDELCMKLWINEKSNAARLRG